MQSNWLDERIGEVVGDAARPFSRRRLLGRMFDVAFKGSLVAVLGLASAKEAWAQWCACSPPRQTWCTNCPGTSGGCPNGYQLCKKVNGVPQDSGCIYTNGWWTEDCGNGTCVTCSDCWNGTPDSSCGCRSNPFPCDGGGGGCGKTRRDPYPCCAGYVCKDGGCVPQA